MFVSRKVVCFSIFFELLRVLLYKVTRIIKINIILYRVINSTIYYNCESIILIFWRKKIKITETPRKILREV